jgi:D-inositol-3-phosphate glycosyltransferase
MRVSLLTGGDDPNYAVPLATALADRGIAVEFVGNDQMEGVSSLRRAGIEYLNLRGNQDPGARLVTKVVRVMRYYQRLTHYAHRTRSRLFHILWLNKFELLDRTLLNALYRTRGKRLVLTVHNVNMRKRDGRDGWLNRASLRTMYSLMDHLLVHTTAAQQELVNEFHVPSERISVIPFGLNTYVPDTALSRREARAHFGLNEKERVLLFFGQIAPYKGLDILLEALRSPSLRRQEYNLLIAGRPKAGSLTYWNELGSGLRELAIGQRVLVRDGFIPDSEVPVLFRAADALVLPYRAIYQSGPLALAYRFGVPVIATRVGSFETEVVQGVTGFLAEPEDPRDLARAIQEYFESELYHQFDETGRRIREIGCERYAWDRIGEVIARVYARILEPEGRATAKSRDSATDANTGVGNGNAPRSAAAKTRGSCSGGAELAGSATTEREA